MSHPVSLLPEQDASIMLVGDIGGTNARFALYHRSVSPSGQTQVTLQHRSTLRAFDFPTLAPLLRAYLAAAAAAPLPGRIVLAICGPIFHGGRVNEPNNIVFEGKMWDKLHADVVEHELGVAAHTLRFINDFEAIGHAVCALADEHAPAAAKPSGACSLYEPPPAARASVSAGAPIGILGAGTGLGACLLTRTAGRFSVWPSEGGMTDTIVPRSELEWRLLKHLRAKYGQFVEVEAIVSGPGIQQVFEFLMNDTDTIAAADAAGLAAARAVLDALESMDADAGPAHIAAAAYAGTPLAAQAVHIFLDFYGRCLGTHAITWMSFGGMYVAGGILPKLLKGFGLDAAPLPRAHALLTSFLNQGSKMSDAVAAVPLLLLDDPDTGLKGCLYVALQPEQ